MACHMERTKRGLYFCCEIHGHEKQKCYKCGKPATKLCDHRDFEMRREVDEYGRVRFKRVASMDTCSRPLCDECALTEDGLDFCHEHGDYFHTVLVTKQANEIYDEMVAQLEKEEEQG